MAQLIDSSIFITLERRGRPLGDLAEVVSGADEPVALASITASELLVGIHMANTVERRLQREAFVEAVLAIVPVLSFDLRVSRIHARLWAALLSRGEQIGDRDLMIAATAIANEHEVLTDNLRHFGLVPGLTVRTPNWS
ncbi:MAG: PIN domain-containing protein [Dehalococcoidia bacterium]